jgi:hypothetical protein
VRCGKMHVNLRTSIGMKEEESGAVISDGGNSPKRVKTVQFLTSKHTNQLKQTLSPILVISL